MTIHWPEGVYNPNAPDPAEDWKAERVYEIPDEEEDDRRDWAKEFGGMENKERQ